MDQEQDERVEEAQVQESPLPVKTMIILCLTILAEPISLTILFPFVYFMVKDFNLSKEEDIGYYVGFLGSSFCFAQFLTASFWGYLSDRFGRRPIILMALLGNSLSLLMFGVSKSLAWAISARLACGLVNGSIGVAKSLLGEITDSTNRARAFSLMSLNFGIGSVIGPALGNQWIIVGGMLAKPAEKYPDVFGNVEFLKEYPYFLPCLCSAAITWVGFTLGYFFLPETCSTIVRYQRIGDEPVEQQIDEADEVNVEAQLESPRAADLVAESAQLTESRGLGFAAVTSIFSYSILAFSDVYFVECFPLWAVAQSPIGLGFDGKQIGMAFAICGVIMLFNQLVIYPEDFNIVKEEDIGYYVGFIASSFSFAQLLTSMFWGYMSDRFGRRPILLIGLIGNSVSMVLFGLSKSLPWAIASRSLCGLLNGNIGVAKSVLGEITDSTNRARAFSLIALNFGIGSIIGPSLGGLLAKPAETYPSIFGGIQFLKDFPYFLPCFCSAMITLCGFTFGYFYLPETNQKGYIKVANEDSEASLEFEPDSAYVANGNDQEVPRESTGPSLADSSNTLVADSGLGLPAIASALAYALLAFSDIVFVETFPLWAVSKPTVGLGFDGTRIGIMFSICGIFILTNQTILYPAIAKHVSSIKLFQVSSLVILVFPYMFPLIAYFFAGNPDLEFLVWPALLITMAARTIINGFLFTTVFVVVIAT
ncbi:hypothetical protein HDV01_006721 [Terramyces sp. JEL0728]|nr:hypothetical protein HDV01_006721 [Terramyces sp. JEL0728]